MATKSDARLAIWRKTLRHHFSHSYHVNLARNIYRATGNPFSSTRELHRSTEEPRVSGMKTMTVRDAKAQLGKLVKQVQHGAPVILVQGDKLAKLERYELLDPECDSPQVEAMLLEAVRGPHAPYSRKELETILEKVSADGSRK